MESFINDVHTRSIEYAKPITAIKNLTGKHQELFVVINLCEDETFSQKV